MAPTAAFLQIRCCWAGTGTDREVHEREREGREVEVHEWWKKMGREVLMEIGEEMKYSRQHEMIKSVS